MILINLLPHREEKRRQRKRAYFISLAVCALVGLGVAGIWYSVLQQLTSAQQARNDFLNAEIARLDGQIRDVATVKAEIERLTKRMQSVESLQNDRNVPVYLLNELVQQTPEGIYLTSIKQNGQVVSITGISQTNERVSEFLRNALYNSVWLEKPDLVEIKASNVNAGSRDQRRLFDFSLRVTIKRPQPQKPGIPASAPAPAPAVAAKKAS